MKALAFWRVSVQTTAEAEDAVAELLGGFFGEPASIYSDLELGQTWCSVYLRAKPERWEGRLRELKRALVALGECGLDVGPGQVELTRLRKQDWAESWKRHFKAIEIGKRLLVKPNWLRKRALPGQRVVILNPGLSFGTGQHPTTRFCLEQLVSAREGGSQSLLDVGTGSGILAIAAVKLGYKPVDAFDYDPEAVRVANENARRNRVVLHVRRKDLCEGEPARRRYDVVCANLLATLLISQRERLLKTVAPGGLIVLAGILQKEFGEVRAWYERAGLKLVASRKEGEWESGSFR